MRYETREAIYEVIRALERGDSSRTLAASDLRSILNRDYAKDRADRERAARD